MVHGFFFENEVSRLQSRFNEVFGKMDVCSLRDRQMVLLSIIGVALIKRNIEHADAQTRKMLVREFLHRRNVILRFLSRIEAQHMQKASAQFDHTTCQQRIAASA